MANKVISAAYVIADLAKLVGFPSEAVRRVTIDAEYRGVVEVTVVYLADSGLQERLTRALKDEAQS